VDPLLRFLIGSKLASSAKIANNLIALTLVTALEGLLLGVRAGLGVEQLRGVIK
jgi:hypothetical protein